MADKVVFGSDHAGLHLRPEAVKFAKELGFEVEDLGPTATDSVDYPDFAKRVAQTVTQGRARFGVLVCGTGIGMAISANKVRGVRACTATSEFEARMARAHNDANVLCLGERVVGVGLGLSILKVFLETKFEGGRHQRRVEKIAALEKE